MPTKSEYETTFINAATTDASISPYASVSPYLAVSSLSPSPDASWTISFEPKETKTTIKAEASYNPPSGVYDAEKIEKYLREQIVLNLAGKLLAEDLIKIQGSTELDSDGSTVYKMKAEVKIIQE